MMSDQRSKNILSQLELSPASHEQLYNQLERQIREKVQTHQWLPGQKLPTNHEICAFLDVSYETVQRAMTSLAEEGIVVRRPGKGTFVNQPTRPGTIGIFCTQDVLDFEGSPFFALMAYHLSRLLQERDQDVHLYHVPDRNVKESKVFLDLMHDLEYRRLSGLVLINTYEKRCQEMLEVTRRRRIPVVGAFASNCCDHRVWFDSFDFCRRGLMELAAQGCERIAVVGFSADGNISPLALLRTEEAQQGLGLQVEEVAVPQLGWGEQSGEKLASLFDAGRFDGLLISDDVLAVGLARALRRHGIRVPEQVKVITWWNRGSPLSLDLPFERFEVDVKAMAEQSLDLLEQLIKGRRISEPQRLMKLERAEPEKRERRWLETVA